MITFVIICGASMVKWIECPPRNQEVVSLNPARITVVQTGLMLTTSLHCIHYITETLGCISRFSTMHFQSCSIVYFLLNAVNVNDHIYAHIGNKMVVKLILFWEDDL